MEVVREEEGEESNGVRDRSDWKREGVKWKRGKKGTGGRR